MSELEALKQQLRSLVVSSPTAVDARELLRDYRNLMGEALPIHRHGYRDPVQFLRERCSDCFLFQGPYPNPVLTLIVPDQLKHIDEFVQKQRMPSTNRRIIKLKRRSVPETYINPPRDNLICRTFKPPLIKDPPVEKPYQNSVIYPKPEPKQPERQQPKQSLAEEQKPESQYKEEPNISSKQTERKSNEDRHSEEAHDGSRYSRRALQRFLQKRNPAYASQPLSERAPSRDSLADDDSGRQTSSSTSSSKQAARERLQAEVAALVAARPAGVPASQLMRLYEERYGRELNYSRLGFASISACACALETVSVTRSPDGDWVVRAREAHDEHEAHAAHGAHGALALAPRVRRLAASRGSLASLQPVDPDDALPGIDYDPDVFPADCLSFVESIPGASVAGVVPGDMLALVVGEVYSPSHLWILRLGPDYDRMEEIMDEMTEYYTKGAGAERVLAAGARRPGQYCSSVYEGDWHRSLIVQLLDCDTVKVRHVDYGTVDTVQARALRPLRREWGALPAMAVRARLAGLCPPAAGRRWPRAAAQHCLRLVRDKRLVGNVVAVDHEEGIVELFLIDTSTAEDVNVTDEMIRAGHADPRRQPALGAPETYLFPLFEALESGATPNYAEIHALLRDGISLDYVEAYRRHVPALLPPPAPPAPPAAPTAPPAPPAPLLNRVPLPWASRHREPERGAPPPPAAPTEPAAASAPRPVSVVTPVTTAVPAPAPLASGPEPSPGPVSAAATPALKPAPPGPPPAPERPPPAPAPAPSPPPPPPAPAPYAPPAPPAHPPAFYASPAYYGCFVPRACPPQYHPSSPFAQYRPAPAPPPPRPAPCFPPAPPYYRAAPPLHDVKLSAHECEIFQLLSLVDKNAAHRYVSEALRRALQTPPPAPAPLNPLAAEFRAAPAPPHPPPPHPPHAAMRPPPGFEYALPRRR